MTKPIIALLLAVLLALLSVAGTMDYEDEKEYAKHACEMVEMGAWPESFCK